MAMTNCPECGRSISTKALVCPHCGCPLPEDVDFRKPPAPIDPSWTERFDRVIRKRKLAHWLAFVFCALLAILFVCLCLFHKREVHEWGDIYHYYTRVEWLALSCVFGAYTIITFGFAVGVSARLKTHVEYMYGYTVLISIGLMLVSVITENKPTMVMFRRTFFRHGFNAKLPDDTEYYVRYRHGEFEVAYSPFCDDCGADDYYHA